MVLGKEGMIKERMTVAQKLWSAGIKVEYSYKLKPKTQAQFTSIEKDSVPWAIILAPQEWEAEGGPSVRVKQQKGKGSEEGESNGEVVKVEDLAAYMLDKTKGKVSSEEILRKVMGVVA